MKTKKRVIGIFVGFLLVFSLFIYLMLRPSVEAQAIDELSMCTSVTDVKACWERNKFELFKGEDETAILNSEYIQNIRANLNSMNLKQKEIEEVNQWLPAAQNLNLIIVPDLSARIKDEANNPGQINNDTALLNQIWKSFEKTTFLKMNSKDKLIVDVSDRSQAQGEFRKIADNLVFDLSEHRNKSNRLYFKGKKQLFEENVQKLYSTAVQKTSGADYVYYFSQVLPTRVKKNTIEDKYRNVLIILTDGYLEATKAGGDIEVFTPNTTQLSQYAVQGLMPQIKLPTATLESSFPSLEVYMFEINERKSGIGSHQKGLKKWWKEWLKSMNIANAEEDNVFHARQDALNSTKQMVEEVIN